MPRTCECCLLGEKVLRRREQIKDLVMKDYPGLWGRILVVITNVLVRQTRGSEDRTGEGKVTTGWRLGQSHHEPGNVAAPEAGRGRDEFSPGASGGTPPCPHLDFGPRILILAFWPPELGANKSLLF